MSKLEEIKERVANATEGPWEFRDAIALYGNERIHDLYQRFRVYIKETNSSWIADCGGSNAGNAYFIAHARSDIPYLLDEIEKLKADAELVRKRVTDWLCDKHKIAALEWPECLWCEKETIQGELTAWIQATAMESERYDVLRKLAVDVVASILESNGQTCVISEEEVNALADFIEAKNDDT